MPTASASHTTGLSEHRLEGFLELAIELRGHADALDPLLRLVKLAGGDEHDVSAVENTFKG